MNCIRNDSRIVRAGVAALLFAASTGFAQVRSGDLPPGIVAQQGGVEVTLQDIDAYASKIPEKDRAGFFDSPKRIQACITSLLLQKQLAAIARGEKLDKDPQIARRIQQAVDDTLAGAQLEHHREMLKMPDFGALAQEYYLTHKDEFVEPGAIEVKHVLVSTKERSDDAAKARIGEVEATARAHPEQFDDLVEKYSDDPSKEKNHGLIENASSSRMAPPFAAAAKELQHPGDISPIVKTSFGYHVLKLVSTKPATQKTFADVRDELVRKLETNFIDKEMDQYRGDLSGKPLEANADLVASLRTRYLKPGQKLPEERAAEAAAAAAQQQAEQEPAKH